MGELDKVLEKIREEYQPDEQARTRVRRAIALSLGTGAEGLGDHGSELGSPPTELGTPSGTAGLAGGAALKWAASTVAVGLLGAAGWMLSASTEPRLRPQLLAPLEIPAASVDEQPSPPPSSAAPSLAEPSEPPTAVPPAVLPPTSKHVEEAPSGAGRVSASAAARRAPTRTEAETSGSTLMEELSLLRLASNQLKQRRPQAALAALKEHRSRYPKSVVASERWGLTVLAQCRLERSSQSSAAAKLFLKRAPHSPLAAHIKTECLK